jgi:hypothetical protein
VRTKCNKHPGTPRTEPYLGDLCIACVTESLERVLEQNPEATLQPYPLHRCEHYICLPGLTRMGSLNGHTCLVCLNPMTPYTEN